MNNDSEFRVVVRYARECERATSIFTRRTATVILVIDAQRSTWTTFGIPCIAKMLSINSLAVKPDS
ncbi:hypothetical protein EEB13_30520 [Rhodococcus sp. WS3]|nr:hypothetical protein EEB13_30520 [Rhodococcus sp. WS3]